LIGIVVGTGGAVRAWELAARGRRARVWLVERGHLGSAVRARELVGLGRRPRVRLVERGQPILARELARRARRGTWIGFVERLKPSVRLAILCVPLLFHGASP
jgi:hypothetical protein